MTNHKCPECGICSYCRQHCAIGHLCEHPDKPIHGHCPHYDDIRPDQCALCLEKARVDEIVRVRDENVELLHAQLDEANVPRGLPNAPVFSLNERLRIGLDRLPGPLNAVGGFGAIHVGVDMGHSKDVSVTWVRCPEGHLFENDSVEAMILQDENICQICLNNERLLTNAY